MLTGNYVHCNVCGWLGRKFETDGWHPGTFCPCCGSQVRHRLLLAALTHLDGLKFDKLVAGKSVLHFAPENSIRKILLNHTSSYLAADYLAEGYQYQLDLQMDLSKMDAVKPAQIDLLLACDVLEHVPNHYAALSEIFRVLKPGGWAILTVPQQDHLETTVDDPKPNTPQERLQRFGQEDHLRIYGRDFSQLLNRAGFQVREIDEHSFEKRLAKRSVLYPPELSTHPFATNFRKVFFAQKPFQHNLSNPES